MVNELVESLRDPGCYPHPVEGVELIETHISWVLLAGDYAYKIKRPVRLAFLDFSTLAERRRCCEEELRLNRRTAHNLYLEVVPITGTPRAPVFGGAGPAIEYAVRMRRFAAGALLDRMARHGALTPEIVDRMADTVAAFHNACDSAPAGAEFGSPGTITAQAIANFDDIALLDDDPRRAAERGRLREWCTGELARLAPVFRSRQASGRVRECHGDLHLGNIALIENQPTPFDCIEFSDALRWIDVMSEIAFLVMDLLDHGLPDLAWRCLNRYLEASGDYEGSTVLALYLAYRAMVRAKIGCIRAHQDCAPPPQAAESAQADYVHHLCLAATLAAPRRPALILMHGLSGSGKTTVAQSLLERLGALRVRSDIERKRLHGLDATARTRSAIGDGIYGAEATRRTYARLQEIARGVLNAGWPMIVDGTFLGAAERDTFRRLAQLLAAPFAIVSCVAPQAVLRERLARRAQEGRDASDADERVLAHQRVTEEPLGEPERERTVVVDAARSGNTAAAAQRLKTLLGLGADRS